jgi:hypothetical protein
MPLPLQCASKGPRLIEFCRCGGAGVPKQNRVTPFGEIVATPERGLFMGNLGVLHNDAGQIQRPWMLKRWLVCVPEFRGRKRSVMTLGKIRFIHPPRHPSE